MWIASCSNLAFLVDSEILYLSSLKRKWFVMADTNQTAMAANTTRLVEDFRNLDIVSNAHEAGQQYVHWMERRSSGGRMFILALLVAWMVGFSLMWKPITVYTIVGFILTTTVMIAGGAAFVVASLILRKPTAPYGGVCGVRLYGRLYRAITRYQLIRARSGEFFTRDRRQDDKLLRVKLNLDDCSGALGERRFASADHYLILAETNLDEV